jgi:hypothetical protein
MRTPRSVGGETESTVEAQVREVLRRVLVDEEFLDQMLTDPERALGEFDLSEEERIILRSRERDLIDLMRIGGEGRQGSFLFINISVELDLTEFITSFHVTVVIEEVARRQSLPEGAHHSLSQEDIAGLAASVRAMRAGADRLEKIHEMLQVVSGATELARRSAHLESEEE